MLGPAGFHIFHYLKPCEKRGTKDLQVEEKLWKDEQKDRQTQKIWDIDWKTGRKALLQN